MRRAAAVGAAAVVFFFLLPMALFGGGETGSSPDPEGTLPLSYTPATPRPSSDGEKKVTLLLPGEEVLTLSLKDYLWRVVAAEMPASFESEALKAQAVAARTYTVSKMSRTVERHPDADMCTDITCCQAYTDPDDAQARWGASAQTYTDKIADAVAATDGMIAVYGGSPIQAVFFSSAAGRTADAAEVWGQDVPYLTGVESPEGEEVPGYHSTVVFSDVELKEKLLSRYPRADLSGAPEGWFQNTVYTSAGGVETVEVGGVTATGQDLRTLLGLRSTSFTVSASQQSVTFSVTGYGHGVGMSQYGANSLAAQGKTWQEIIKWYYTGVEIEPMP